MKSLKRAAVAAVGTALFSVFGAIGAGSAHADYVHPYATSPYFGGQLVISTTPGTITLRAIQTTVGSFPYGCWAAARNLETNSQLGTRDFVRVFPRVWQAEFGGLPNGRYEILQRCGDGTSLIRERSAFVDLDGGGAVTPEEEKPFAPDAPSNETCSAEVSRKFQEGGIPTEVAVEVVERIWGLPLGETTMQQLCLLQVRTPEQAFENVCNIGKSLIPADIAYAAIAQLGKTIGSPEVYWFGESARVSWEQQCKN